MQVVFAFMHAGSGGATGQYFADAAASCVAFCGMDQLFELARLHIVKLLHLGQRQLQVDRRDCRVCWGRRTANDRRRRLDRTLG